MGSKPAPSPMPIGLLLYGDKTPLLEDMHQYRRIIERNQFLSPLIQPQKISSADQIEDLFTKALPVVPFTRLTGNA
ncbi:hypothetical protein LIER_30064 [Lithospermum erythrorhizon]|uniref:Uncharacterized protein n=1 Tax=Lithospermum erythrorhizon TaxID=34254 RepID=A0AAV3RMF3_LITER